MRSRRPVNITGVLGPQGGDPLPHGCADELGHDGQGLSGPVRSALVDVPQLEALGRQEPPQSAPDRG
jgi:hypothetical protein